MKMEIRFTKHALLRMSQRGISEDEVYEIFDNPALVLERSETIVVGRTNRRRYLTLIFDMREKKLLTLYPSSRKQRRLYQERGEQR